MRRTFEDSPFLPYLLLCPVVGITFVFAVWPALQAIYESFFLGDAFGMSSKFVWFENFVSVLSDPNYLNSVKVTFIFTSVTVVLSIGLALLFAVTTDSVVKGVAVFKTGLMWTYAVAPAVAGILWIFMFAPSNGILTRQLEFLGINWDPYLFGDQALTVVIMASVWKQLPYNYVFFLAGLQAIPKSLQEAAIVDGASYMKRFWTIVFPLMAPVTFFLIVVNTIFTLFDTFGIIHVVTDGGPARATETLVFKIFRDGFLMGDISGSSAQSVILLIIVTLLVIFQFRFIERKIHY